MLRLVAAWGAKSVSADAVHHAVFIDEPHRAANQSPSSMSPKGSGSGAISAKDASTVTRPAGMVNVYLPSPLSVRVISLSRLSRTVRLSSSYPSSRGDGDGHGGSAGG